MPIVAT
jgi:Mn2+/Fe2+ NRAMP family transporter